MRTHTGWGSERVKEAKQALQPCIIKEAKQMLQLCIMIEANLWWAEGRVWRECNCSLQGIWYFHNGLCSVLQLAQPFEKAVAVPIYILPPPPTPPQISLYVMISTSSLELICCQDKPTSPILRWIKTRKAWRCQQVWKIDQYVMVVQVLLAISNKLWLWQRAGLIYM